MKPRACESPVHDTFWPRNACRCKHGAETVRAIASGSRPTDKFNRLPMNLMSTCPTNIAGAGRGVSPMSAHSVSRRPRIFTPQVFSQISSLVDQGLGAPEIAERIGCKLGSLRVRCSQHGISLRRRSRSMPASERKPQQRLTIHLYGSAALRLQYQAGKRGTSVSRFAAALLEAIVQDNLYDAVIDQDTARARANDEIGRRPRLALSVGYVRPSGT